MHFTMLIRTILVLHDLILIARMQPIRLNLIFGWLSRVQFTVTVTQAFIDYIQTQPIVFELCGHYQPRSALNKTLLGKEL